MPKVVHNVQFTMTNVQSVLHIGQSLMEFIELFCSMTNCRMCRRIVMEHWPNANEKRCTKAINTVPSKETASKAALSQESIQQPERAPSEAVKTAPSKKKLLPRRVPKTSIYRSGPYGSCFDGPLPKRNCCQTGPSTTCNYRVGF